MQVTNHKYEPIIHMQGIKKRFGSFYALNNITLDIYAGEIHALMGENGAGKSTLMKILAGSYTATEGKIFIDGKEVSINTPQDALDAGISLIYQEINLAPNLSVAENIFMGQEYSNNGLIDRNKMIQETEKFLSRLGASFYAWQKAGELTIAEQQQVEIARALHRKSRILVMDEPTAALSSKETDILFQRIKKLRDAGIAIVYISHRMGEIYELADRVTVLRDGSSVGRLLRDELNADRLVSMMVGRSLGDVFNHERMQQNEDDKHIVLEVKDLSDTKGRVNSANLYVKKGEVVGLSGLVGSGRTELARLIFGADSKGSGEIYLHQKKRKISSPHDAMSYGISYLPENRKDQGLFLKLSVKNNIIINSLLKDSSLGIVNRKKGFNLAQDVIQKMRIRVSSMFTAAGDLSGGNQQKTLIARWVSLSPEVLLLDEPTRGVDIGAKMDIYQSIFELADQGCAILMISSELPEIVGMCDRVYVLRESTIVGELDGNDISQENIMHLATGAEEFVNHH